MEMDKWFDLRNQVCSAAPDLDPPPQYWLESDCSLSYCRKCVIIERGKEFEFGPPIRDIESYARNDLEDAFFDGISGDMHRNAGTSDITAQCYTCGMTLAYWLTDEGIASELEHWSDAEMRGDMSEIAYNIDRLFECSDGDKPDVEALALRFLEYAKSKP